MSWSCDELLTLLILLLNLQQMLLAQVFSLVNTQSSSEVWIPPETFLNCFWSASTLYLLCQVVSQVTPSFSGLVSVAPFTTLSLDLFRYTYLSKSRGASIHPGHMSNPQLSFWNQLYYPPSIWLAESLAIKIWVVLNFYFTPIYSS